MDCKMMLFCVVTIAAVLLGQTRASCIGNLDAAIKQIEIPQFAKEIESRLRSLNTDLAHLPLVDLIGVDSLHTNLLRTGFFSEQEVEAGKRECQEFVDQVVAITPDSDCSAELNKIPVAALQAEGKWLWLLGYVGACELTSQFVE